MKACNVKGCSNPRVPLGGKSKCREHYNAYHRKYAKENRERHHEIARKSRRKRYHEDWRQRWRDYVNNCVQRAIKQGLLKREPCEVCGADAHAHHDSYYPTRILAVRWLCQIHHKEWHRKNKYRFPSKERISRIWDYNK